MREQTHMSAELPDDVVLRVNNVSKKFCRNLKRSMWYGIQDLSRNLIGQGTPNTPPTLNHNRNRNRNHNPNPDYDYDYDYDYEKNSNGKRRTPAKLANASVE